MITGFVLGRVYYPSLVRKGPHNSCFDKDFVLKLWCTCNTVFALQASVIDCGTICRRVALAM